MLFQFVFALGLQRVVTGDADVFSGQDLGPTLVQQEALGLSAEAPVDKDKTAGVLKRQKRDWIVPPISISEGYRGPFPQKMVQFKTSHVKELKIIYSITGPGADQPPTNLFTIDRETGQLYVTRPLDREQQDVYEFIVTAATEAGIMAEEPMSILVKVIDQNDNKPVFEKEAFLGTILESSPIGTEFMQVVATDADEPGNANSDIRYKILSQDPPLPFKDMFDINPLSGKIRVKTAGLDAETISRYLLEIQASDNEGYGLAAFCKTFITVTHSNDNAPQFSVSEYTASVYEDVVGASVVTVEAAEKDEPQTPVDDDEVPATGTGTLVIELEDVNDHPPTIRNTSIAVCNQDPEPVVLPVLDGDGDGPGLSAPFRVELMDPEQDHWTAHMNSAGTGVVLKLKPSLLQRDFKIVLKVCDRGGLCSNSPISAHVHEENCVIQGSFCII